MTRTHEGGDLQGPINDHTESCSLAMSFAPDGESIVFGGGGCFSDPAPLHLRMVNTDGTGERILDAPYPASYPDFSPDGGEIAYTYTAPDSSRDIFATAPDGSGARLVIEDARYPQWSPDGTRILFHSDRAGQYELYTVAPDGTNLQRLTNNDWTDYQASWSPEGTHIVYVREGPTFRDPTSLVIMNADGTGARMLGVIGRHPKWSPTVIE